VPVPAIQPRGQQPPCKPSERKPRPRWSRINSQHIGVSSPFRNQAPGSFPAGDMEEHADKLAVDEQPSVDRHIPKARACGAGHAIGELATSAQRQVLRIFCMTPERTSRVVRPLHEGPWGPRILPAGCDLRHIREGGALLWLRSLFSTNEEI
jgi:hypothetical protein